MPGGWNTNWTMRAALGCFGMLLWGGLFAAGGFPQSAAKTEKAPPAKMILDTDIGDDIDDAFALALALRSPEIKVIGITTAWGDTALRARLVNRFLKETGTAHIPVVAGVATKSKATFSQSA